MCTPSPWSRKTRSGKAAFAWETRIAGPVSGAASSGVTAVAVPTTARVGQLAGLTANTVSRHASCSVSRREGSETGSCSWTLRMWDSPGCCSRRTEKLVRRRFVKFAFRVVDHEGGACDLDLDLFEAERHAVDGLRQRVARDRDRGGDRVDADRGADDDGAEVERPRFGGHDDREAEGRALVFAGQVDRPGGGERRGAGTGDRCGGRDARVGGTRSFVRVRFVAARYPRDFPEQAGRRHDGRAREILFAVVASREDDVERAVGAGRRVFGARLECGREGQAGGASFAGAVPVDAKGRVGGGDRVTGDVHAFGGRAADPPRRQGGAHLVAAARDRVLERGARAALQLQFEFFEGCLRVVREGGRDLAGGRVDRRVAGNLHAHARAFGFDEQAEQLAIFGFRGATRFAFGLADVDAAGERLFEQLRDDRDGPHLRGRRTGALAGGGNGDRFVGARYEAVGGRGRERDARGQRDRRVFEVRRGERGRHFVLRDFEVEVVAGRGGRAGAGRGEFDRRFELEFVATGHGGRRCRFRQPVRAARKRVALAFERSRHLPAVIRDRRHGRFFGLREAVRGVRQERDGRERRFGASASAHLVAFGGV